MRLSASNLAWGSQGLDAFLTAVREHGLQGVEIAPTAVWPESPSVSHEQIAQLRARLQGNGLQVSGLQSLLYGKPDLQLLDRSTWPSLLDHLRQVIGLAGALGATCAVFGSPRNRQRGRISVARADEIAAEFFALLEPVLRDDGVVLTLEPNAPEYGADYLTHYTDVVRLAGLIGSPWVQPQIDTGCLAMVGDDAAAGARTRIPGHVHVSAPHLVPPPAGLDHRILAKTLRGLGYKGWVVLEMLPAGDDPRTAAVLALDWLRTAYGPAQ
jgi:sugar phosphate isomerase/epimerase